MAYDGNSCLDDRTMWPQLANQVNQSKQALVVGDNWTGLRSMLTILDIDMLYKFSRCCLAGSLCPMHNFKVCQCPFVEIRRHKCKRAEMGKRPRPISSIERDQERYENYVNIYMIMKWIYSSDDLRVVYSSFIFAVCVGLGASFWRICLRLLRWEIVFQFW